MDELLPETKTARTSYKYDPKYCEELIAHMKQGLSFQAFAGAIGVSYPTLFNWTKKHDEFNEAYQLAQGHCRLYWEKVGTKAVNGGIPFFNNPLWIFNMKNRFGWRDNLEITDGSTKTKKEPAKPGKKNSPYVFLEAKKKSDG